MKHETAAMVSQRIRGIAVNGKLLRELRRQRGLTQEEFAELARVTVRLVSKAEGGGPIDAWSLRALAAVVSRPDRPVQAHELAAATVSAPGAAEQTVSAVVLLGEFLRAIWDVNGRPTLERLAHKQLALECEQGTLLGRESLFTRLERLHQIFGPAQILVYDASGGPTQAACRWRLTTLGQTATPDAATVRHGMTSIVTQGSRILRAWEFWDPDPRRPVLPPCSPTLAPWP